MTPMTATIYGLKTCDTCRKALSWLSERDVNYRSVDVRADGLDKDDLTAWCQRLGWQTLVNRRSRTWRELPEQTKTSMDDATAVAAILAQPTLMKRPLLLTTDGGVHVGFTPAGYAQIFSPS